MSKEFLRLYMRGWCEKDEKNFIFHESSTGTPYIITGAKIIYKERGSRFEWIVIKDRIKWSFRMVGNNPRDWYSLEKISFLLPRNKYRAFNRRAGRDYATKSTNRKSPACLSASLREDG